MSRSVVCSLKLGATALESLSSLQRRLQSAEEQSEELVRGLGVSADHLLLNSSSRTPTKHQLTSVNLHQVLDADGEGLVWRLCETLVSRVCRLESLLHTLKLASFRLEKNRELNPSQTAHLQEQLRVLQGQYEDELRSSRREVLKLQDRLQQACDESKEAQQEVLRLKEVLQSTRCAKIAQETRVDLEAEQSHNALLHRVEEMERVVERKSGQVKALEAACHTLQADRQVNMAELEKKTVHILSLERECQQLRDQSGVKETLISELSKEIKNLKTSLQNQEHENRRLMRDERDLRAAAADVQVLNDKLEVQCSELKATLQSLTLKNARIQTEYQSNIKEQKQLLDTVRRNSQTELQSATSEQLTIQKQLEVLKADHAKLQQSSSVAQQTAVNHQQMLEQTIQRLQEELSCALREEENMRNESDQIKSQVSSNIVLLENEKNVLETQLSEMKIEFSVVNSGLQKQEKENKALMESLAVMQHQQETHRQVEQMLWDMTDSTNKLAYEKGKLQAQVKQMGEDLKTMKAECTQHCQLNITLQNSHTQAQSENNTLKEHLHMLQQQQRDKNEVVQVLENVLASYTLLQQNTQTLQTELQDKTQELHTLKQRKLQAMKEIQKLTAEVQHLEKLTHTAGNKAESLQKALNEAQMDNRKLAQSLETLLQENHNAQEKLNTLSQREVELKQARAEICRLTEHTDSLKKLLKREKDSMQQLKKALDEASVKSHDLSQANQELREKVSELEKLVSSQKSLLDSRTPENSLLRIKDLEVEIESLEEIKDEYKKKSYKQSQSLQQLHSEMASLQTELQCLASIQQGELQAERDLNHRLQGKYLHLEESLKRLQEERDEAEASHGEITENTTEDHRDLCSISDSFSDECEPQEARGNFRTEKDAAAQDKSQTHSCVFDPELEPWAFTLQRWEITKDLTRGYKPTRRK